MIYLQAAFVLFFGAGLLMVVWQSLAKGWLPCGPNGLRGRLEFRRDSQPLGFWTMFALYGTAGLWLLIFGLRLLAGSAEPLPLR
jgi:hypothetical protein